MRGFQLTVFALSIVFLCMQGVHFVYYKYVYSHESVLDDNLDKQIRKTESLGELVQAHTKALAKVESYKVEHPDENLQYYQRQNKEPYKSQIKLENAIKDWESKARGYARLWYQWLAGVFLFIVGGTLFWLNRSWLGITIITAGLGEMIWWSSPNLTVIGSLLEYEKLLNTKLIFTVLTFILLTTAWLLSEAKRKNRESDL